MGEPYKDPLDASYRHPEHASEVPRRFGLLLDHFPGVEVMERASSEGLGFLRRRCVLQLAALVTMAFACGVCTGITMGLGYLNNNKRHGRGSVRRLARLSWLPSILVLLTGLSILFSLVAAWP